MRILVRDVERVTFVGAVVARHCGARLDGVRNHPVIDDIELGDVRCVGECRIDGRLVAERPGIALVVGCDIVNRRRARLERIDWIDDGGQYFVVDVDQFRGVFGLGDRLCDH